MTSLGKQSTTLDQNTQIAHGCLHIVSAVIIVVLLGLVAFIRYLILPALAELSPDTSTNIAVWDALMPLMVFVILALPLGLLVYFIKTPCTRTVFQMWLWAAFYPVVLIPATLFDPIHAQWSLLLTALLSVVYFALAKFFLGWPRPSLKQPFLIALIPVSLLAIAWLILGALGSFLDGVLVLIISLVVGLLASQLLHHYWFNTLEKDKPISHLDFVLGGLIVGVMLALLSSNLGFNGTWLLSGLMIPAVGWLVMVLVYHSRANTRLAVALLIGLTAGLPLWFADSDVLTLVVWAGSPGESFLWLLLAVGICILLGWLMGGIGYALRLLMGDRGLPRPGKIILLLLLTIVGLALYLLVGQPGLHGDRLFVILKDQADVSSASQIEDYNQRRQFVYDTLTDHATTSQSRVRRMLDLSLTNYTPYYLVNGLEVRGGIFHRLLLSVHPDVDRILASPVLRPLPTTPEAVTGDEVAPTRDDLWNLSMIGADRVWSEFNVRGEGVVIGQSDSGVEWIHPELQPSYRGGEGDHDYNWLDPWDGDAEPTDISGHGTHTLGSIVGESVGVAPDASWFGCKNLGRNLANPALYLDCLQFMLAPFPLDGDPFIDGDPMRSAHVLNNSWGCPHDFEGCDPTSLQLAVEALRSAGIFVVASAGNSGPGCSSIDSPIAIYDAVFTVGAVTQSGSITSFSSVGPVTVDGSERLKPDIIAPGSEIISAFPNGSYAELDGTSMAGPHVAGVVALVWSANPALIGDIEATEAILRTSATRYTGSSPTGEFSSPGCSVTIDTSIVPNNIAGYGIVNAYGAVELAIEQR